MTRTLVFGVGACEIAILVDGQIVKDTIDIEIPGANTKEKFMKGVKGEYPDCLINVLGEVKFVARRYGMQDDEFFEHAGLYDEKEVEEGFGSRKKKGE